MHLTQFTPYWLQFNLWFNKHFAWFFTNGYKAICHTQKELPLPSQEEIYRHLSKAYQAKILKQVLPIGYNRTQGTLVVVYDLTTGKPTQQPTPKYLSTHHALLVISSKNQNYGWFGNNQPTQPYQPLNHENQQLLKQIITHK